MRKIVLFMLLLLVTGCVQQSEKVTETENLVVTCPEFKYGGFIPSKYTCDGEGINPPLQIECLPEGTILSGQRHGVTRVFTPAAKGLKGNN